jgi:hypothetical protein
MSITIGQIYKFAFIDTFASLNGIYRVTHSMDYNTLLETDVDLMVTLFTPAGLTEQDMQTALPDISTDTFYRLVSPDGLTTLNVPYQYIVGIPVPDVNEYSKIMLAVDLGPWAEPDVLPAMITVISNYLQNGWGVVKPPELMAYETEWMSAADYEAIKQSRQNVIDSGLGVPNYYAENMAKQTIINNQAARIAALEEIVRLQDALLNP